MEQYALKGGNPLVGEVEVGGAKNAALGVLAAAIMTDDMTVIENLPDVRDINVLLQAMESIGVIIYRSERHTVRINASMISGLVIEDDYIKKNKSVLLSSWRIAWKIQACGGGASGWLQYWQQKDRPSYQGL